MTLLGNRNDLNLPTVYNIMYYNHKHIMVKLTSVESIAGRYSLRAVIQFLYSTLYASHILSQPGEYIA